MITVLAAVIMWATALYCLWRWPIVAVGLPAALALWTVAPWACWTGLAITSLAATALWLWGATTRPGRAALLWLFRRPMLPMILVSAAVAALGEPPLAPAAFVVLLVSLLWTCRSWPQTVSETPEPAIEPVRRLLVESGPCPTCDGLLVVSNRDQPRATCAECGIRFIGVLDATAPNTGLTWFQIPA